MKSELPAYSRTISIAQVIWSRISSKLRVNLTLCLFLMISSGFLESLSLAGVFAVITVAVGDDANLMRQFLNGRFVQALDNDRAAITLILLAGITFCLSSLTRLLTFRYTNYTSAKIGSEIGISTFNSIFQAPFLTVISGKSSEWITDLISGTGQIISISNMFLQLLSSSIIGIFIIITAIYIGGYVAVWGILIIALSAILSSTCLRLVLVQNSKVIMEESDYISKITHETRGNIKDLILGNNLNYFSSLYLSHDTNLRYHQARSNVQSSYPKYAVEMIIMIAIVLYSTASLLHAPVNKAELFGTLTVLMLCAQRLLPAVQNIVSSWSIIRSNLSGAQRLLTRTHKRDFDAYQVIEGTSPPYINPNLPIGHFESISLSSVSFLYPNSSTAVLRNVDLIINKAEKLAIVGKSGSGKTTLLNLLVGLLPPTTGNIFINRKNVYSSIETLISWRRSIGYVPQDPYISNASIAQNIAFAKSSSDINIDYLKYICKIVSIHDFIESLPDSYRTLAGEVGSTLSGGQKQRIALARALYLSPSILIIDEGTNALDESTEKIILANIHCEFPDLAIISVTHDKRSASYFDTQLIIHNQSIVKK